MGYTTNFNGSFSCTPTLQPEHKEYLRKFCETRRMKRNASLAGRLPDLIRKAAKLPIGPTGAYFVGAGGFMGQDADKSVLDFNECPDGQPGLWCKWTPNEDGTTIEWSGAEKFYDYVEWLQYIIDNFLKRWGYTLNGDVEWQGENTDDIGVIRVVNNVVQAVPGTLIEEMTEEIAALPTGEATDGFTDRDIDLIRMSVDYFLHNHIQDKSMHDELTILLKKLSPDT